MIHSENPDPLGSLFGELTDDVVPAQETKHAPTPEVGTGTTPTDRPFPTRRELRAQREAAERAAAGVGSNDAGSSDAAASDAAAADPAPTESSRAAVASAATPVAQTAAAAEFDALLHADAVPAEPAVVVADAVAFTSHAEDADLPTVFLSDVTLVEESVAESAVTASDAPRVPNAPVAESHLAFAAPVVSRSPLPEDIASDRAGRAAAQRRSKRAIALRSAAESGRVTAKTARPLRERVTAAGVIVVVGGIFATLTLPAYASHDAAGLAAAKKQMSSQSFSAGNTTASEVTRDAFGVTSAADLKGQYANALKQRNMQAYLLSGAQALGDDYPWATDLTRGEGGGLSPLRYYYRECVDFVAWRLNRDAGSTTAPYKWDWSTLTPGNGNASGWKSAWQDHGWAMGKEPQVGSVAWFPSNHVAYVSGVLGDGSVVLEEYNWNNDHTYDQRIVQPDDVAMFLYAPPK